MNVLVEEAGVENFSLNLHNFLGSKNAVRIVITDFMLHGDSVFMVKVFHVFLNT